MPDDWKQPLDSAVSEGATKVVALRRHLHAHPELSGAELQTSLHLYQLLGKLNLDVRMGPEGCGVVAENRADAASGRTAFRGDIDALSIQDDKSVAYRSMQEGVMHACGHDAHAAVVYGTILALTKLEAHDALPWPVTWRAI